MMKSCKSSSGLVRMLVSGMARASLRCMSDPLSVLDLTYSRHYAASKSRIDIGKLLISRGADINAKDNANQIPLHRAATTGSMGFIRLLLENKTRLNNADRIGNTPLHLAMDSAHAEAAVALINAGADRGRLNLDEEAPEDVQGVGGSEQRKAKQYVIESCGPRDP
ncbi:ankyrin repeat-containing domain protein [Roridomyces roridus]|uniref:Ankyrin repeat-containing domain protein n=1 Tax=Roridomyces roridus TaxID=1738132 RepID=A0AAD7CKE8_9AGAR|nr:ankyrin repeat-containing domain protein [Roridomyces roridus]